MRSLDTIPNFTPGSASTWVDKDLSTYISSGEICAVFIVTNASPKTAETIKIRAKGSTIDPPSCTLPQIGWVCYLTYLDLNDIVQIWSDQANTQFKLIGFMNESSIKKTDLGDNYIDKTSSVGTTCTGLDLTDDIDTGDSPVGAFWQSGYVSTSDPLVSYSQSTSTCANSTVMMDPLGSGLTPTNTSTDIAYLLKANSPDVWLFGFIARDSSIARSVITPISDTGEGWQDLEDIGSHNGAAYFFEYDKSGDVASTIGLRKNGDTGGFAGGWKGVHDGSTDIRGVVLYAQKGTSDIIEWYRPGASQDQPSNIIRLAYLENAASGPFFETLTDGFTLNSFLTLGGESVSIIEDFTINAIQSSLRTSSLVFLENITLSAFGVPGFSENLTDNINLNSILSLKVAFNSVVTDTATLDDVLITSFPRFNIVTEDIELEDISLSDLIANIIESINFIDLLLSGATLNVSLISGMGINDNLLCIFPRSITESINLSLIESTQSQYTNTIADSQALTGILSNNAVFYTESTGFFTVNDNTLQIDIILEDLAINDIGTVLAKLHNTILENEEITSIGINNISAYLTNSDSMAINDSSLSRHFGSVVIEDGMKFEIEVEFGNQEYSGWVMNPENYAVSNYTFNFTDSVLLGDKYLFSSPNGLYELGGITDDENAIEARVKTAALDFGDENIKQIRQAILGTDGNRYILAVAVDDAETVFYELIAPSSGLSNKRLKIGKGLLGTRWQFELIHRKEEKFKLESMELFPVIFKRKLK